MKNPDDTWQDRFLDFGVALHAAEKNQSHPRPSADVWAEACESQGLPLTISMERFVRHHRLNAGLAAFMEGTAIGWLSGGHHDGFCRGCAYNHAALQGYGLTPDKTYAITTAAHDEGIAAVDAHEPINTEFDRNTEPMQSLSDEITLLRTVVATMADQCMCTENVFLEGTPEKDAYRRALAERLIAEYAPTSEEWDNPEGLTMNGDGRP